MKIGTVIWGGLLWLLLIAIIIIMPYIPFSSEQKVILSILGDKGSDRAIIFFGYSRCGDVCPITMLLLRNMLETHINQLNWPQVIFVDIDRESNMDHARIYARSFHEKFIGYHLSPTELKSYSEIFGLNIHQINNQISHQGRTYILQRKKGAWWIVKTYNPKSLTSVILRKELIKTMHLQVLSN